VYLASAELASVAALLGRLPTPSEYLEQVQALNAKAKEVYTYMSFDKIKTFSDVADTVTI
jgi:aconitate hydratase 2/2-methylisocitrate dehydratase